MKDYLTLINNWEAEHTNDAGKHLANVSFSNLYIAFEKNNINVLSGGQKLLFFGKRVKDVITGVKKPALPKSKVLMWPVSLNHCDNMMPVYFALKEKNIDVLVITNKKAIYHYLLAAKVEVTFIEINNWWPYLKRLSVLKEINSFSPKGIKARAITLFKTVLRRFMDENLAIMEFSSWLLETVKPKVVFVGFDITAEGRAMCLKAQEANVQTRCIQHGDIAGFFDDFHVASGWYVFGEQARETLNKQGYTNTIISGSPALDKVYHKFKQREARERKAILALFSGPGVATSMEHHLMQFDAIFSWNIKNPETQIIVKFHPKDKIQNYKELIDKYPGHTIKFSSEVGSSKSKNIFDWLESAGLVLTGASTAAMEALLMDIPVVSLDFKKEYKSVDFLKTEAICKVDNRDQLHSVLDSWQNTAGFMDAYLENGRKYISKYYLLDGMAAERIANTLDEWLA